MQTIKLGLGALSVLLFTSVAWAAALAPGERLILSRGPCAVAGSGFHLSPPATCGNEGALVGLADATCGASLAGARAVHVELVRATVRADGSCANDDDYGADLECCVPKCQ